MSEEEKKLIKKKFENLRRKGQIESTELDKAVLEPLKMEGKDKNVSSYARALSKARREGKEVSEMISGIEEEEELEGAEIISEGKGQKKLTEF